MKSQAKIYLISSITLPNKQHSIINLLRENKIRYKKLN